MYEFRDVIEALEGDILPSEALKINGEYIENQISGYRTLNVKGREALSPDVVTFTTGVRDGSRIKSKRFPERIITVTYQLAAESNEAFREAFNKLAAILNVEEAELIFNDEQDKFFIGTPCIIGEVKPGSNIVVGEFEILCADPFKYSVIEYEAEPLLEDSSILLDYHGTYKAYPKLEAEFYKEEESSEDGETAAALTGAGDCGFVAFFNEREKIIQIGNPDEADEAKSYAESQTLINQTFQNNNSWGSAAKALWAVNNGYVLPSSVVQGGDVGMAVASYAVASTPADTSGTLLRATSTAGAPTFNYTVTAKATQRTANSVKVNLAITAALGRDASYFGRGYGLTASVYIGGAWRNVTLKNTTDYWRGKTGHTVNLSVTVSGLSASTASITGIKFKVTRTDSLGNAGKLGETACSNLRISQYTAGEPATYYLRPTSYGSAIDKWHGVSISRTIPADANGDAGAANFTLTYKQKLCIGNGNNASKQLGAFQLHITDTAGNHLCGVRIWKCTPGNKAKLQYYVQGNMVKEINIDLSYNNRYFGAKEDAVQTSTITKSGKNIKINTGGHTMTMTVDSIAEVKANKVTFVFEQWSNLAALDSNGLYWAKFVKHNCDQYKDVPNKFGADDVLIADCKSGEIFLNGLLSPELGALGNDWEEFYLTPGLNQIGIAYSTWLSDETAPKMKVRYREVFL